MPSTTHRRRQPFFRVQETHDLIEQIAAAESLTIFVGAGISIDRGSLTWDELVVRLLGDRLFSLDGHNDMAMARAGARALASALGPVAAASAVRELYQREWPTVKAPALMELIANDIFHLLYPARAWSPGGALAEAIVRLAVVWKSLDRDVTILTTNYDNNLEDFAGDTSAQELAKKHRLTISARVDAKQRVGGKTIPVFHLNGYIPHVGDREGNLAFSETGLAIGGEVVGSTHPRLDWRAKVLEQRLRATTAIFVGTTLRDLTVVNGLIRTAATADCPRYGIFPYQGDAWCDDEPELRFEANTALAARLAHLRVEPIRPDYYGQVAQLLNEIVHSCVNCAGQYRSPERYGDRLRRWWKEWCRQVHYTHPPKQHQDTCQEILAATRDHVASVLSPQKGELLKLELWIRNHPPDRRQLELWGSSHAASRTSPGERVRAKIQNQSDYAAVRAFCQGFDFRGPVQLRVGQAQLAEGRWKSHFSVPIVLQAEPWHRLPVGVISLLSSRPEDSSCLRHLNEPDPWEETRRVVAGAGARLLDPNSDVWKS